MLHPVLCRILFAAAGCWMAVAGPAGAAAGGAGRVTFSQSVAPFAEDVQVLGSAAPQASVSFQIGFRLRNGAALDGAVRAGKAKSWAELKADHLPARADYDQVLNWLTDAGLTVERTTPSRLTIWASGPVAVVQRALNVHFSRIATQGRTYVSADSAPSLPRVLAGPVQGVFGLQPQIRAHPMGRQGPAMGTRGPTTPPFYPSSFLKAYRAKGLGDGGAGTTTAIVIDTFPRKKDLQAYWAATGTAQRLANISFINTTGLEMGGASTEASMDTEVASSIAPDSRVRVYASTDLTAEHLDTSFNRLIDDMGEGGVRVTQVSISIGMCELHATHDLLQRDNGFFRIMSAMGASVFVSSGDAGSRECGRKKGETVSFYASSPFVTAVGGTRLELDDTGKVTSETAWSGSGGGVSARFRKPPWQSHPDLGYRKRALPDLAADADPDTGAYVVISGEEITYGGTSLSAPLVAGLMALVNAERLGQGKDPLGLLNERIYGLRPANFRDITEGDNIGYTAGPGYDLVTGLGAPDMKRLLPTLAAQP